MKLYHIVGLAAGVVALTASGLAQSVTVNSNGGADFTSISLALAAVQSNPAGPDVITIQNAGPFIETGTNQAPAILNITGDSANNDITIQATSPSIRPLLIASSPVTTPTILIKKIGNALVRDLIIIPSVDRNQSAAVVSVDDTGVAGAANGYNVTLRNILVSSNNGTSQPLASLDGLTSPTYVPTQTNFTGDILNAASNVNSQINKLYNYDFVISGLIGNNFNGFRGFPDGAAGSEWVVGDGCVVSYCTALSLTTHACWQPGGDDGSADIVKLIGTQAKPVKFVNNFNLNAIQATGTGFVNNKLTCQWLMAANNLGSATGFIGGKTDQQHTFTNCTFVNNGTTAGRPQSTFQQVTNATTTTLFTNVIAAGTGTEETLNAVKMTTTSPSTGQLILNQSAVVLNGPYKLTNTNFGGDGIEDSVNVVPTGVVNADPQFASLNPASANFLTVTNPAYATAGPGGVPLVGAGSYSPTAAVHDWSIYN